LGFLFTIEGIPMVYYGTEQGFSGGGDPYNREDLWKLVPDFNQAHPIYQWIRKLSSLRRSSLPLGHGDFVVLYRDDFIYAYSRAYGEEETIVVLNLSLDTKSVDVSLRSDTRLNGTLINLLDEAEIVQVSDGKIFVELGPREIKIFGKEIVQKFVYLTISTVPEGGEIIIDGVSRGFAPLTVELTEGRHVVSFGDIEGYKRPDDMIIDIHENRLIVVEYQLLENIEIENVPITVPKNVYVLEIPKLHPLEKHVYSLMTEFVPIKRVTLKTKELIERVWIRFKPLKEPPRDTTPPKGLVYSYVEMVSNAGENFENILIEFCIKKSWIEDHNIMKETITLARLSNGSWEFLPTWLELEEDGEIMYVSLLREFSVYSVVGWSREMAARPEVLPTATWETGVQQNLELQKMLVERSWELEEMRSKLSNLQILFSVLCVGFLLIGVGVGWLIHRRSKR
jgi:PGF-pre-PGF domain-containing protein